MTQGTRFWPRWASWLTPLVALLAYLAFWPVPIDPVAWQAPQSAGYTGAHSPNQRLADLKHWGLGGHEGPEHVLSHGGLIYTALSNGDVLVFNAQGQSRVLVNTGGRPLGLAVGGTAGQEMLYIADAMRGLLGLPLGGASPDAAPTAARLRVLMDKVDFERPDEPLAYPDAVVVDARGQVWLTDASTRFAPRAHGGTFAASLLDVLENSCSGRLLVYDPQAGRGRVALTGLCFPNGLAFSANGQSLMVAETARYRILSLDLARLGTARAALGLNQAPTLPSALGSGAARVLIDNLPGFPDNLMRGEQGRIWTGLTKPRSAITDWAASHPWVRRMTMRLPRALWPVPPAYGHLVAFDEQGRILDDLQDPSGAYPETTAGTEAGGKLFVHSLNAKTLGWMPYPGPATALASTRP